jgi:hypothetical protein
MCHAAFFLHSDKILPFGILSFSQSSRLQRLVVLHIQLLFNDTTTFAWTLMTPRVPLHLLVDLP